MAADALHGFGPRCDARKGGDGNARVQLPAVDRPRDLGGRTAADGGGAPQRIGLVRSRRRQEIEGVVTEVRWQNPHVLFFVRAPSAGGAESIWEIERNTTKSARFT